MLLMSPSHALDLPSDFCHTSGTQLQVAFDSTPADGVLCQARISIHLSLSAAESLHLNPSRGPLEKHVCTAPEHRETKSLRRNQNIGDHHGITQPRTDNCERLYRCSEKPGEHWAPFHQVAPPHHTLILTGLLSLPLSSPHSCSQSDLVNRPGVQCKSLY